MLTLQSSNVISEPVTDNRARVHLAMRLLCGVPHHHAQKRYARVTFFGSHPPSPLFLQHHSCRTGTPDPGGYTHRVSPSSDRFFCPCSGYLTCDCQFFQQLADRILPNRPRNSFLFTGIASGYSAFQHIPALSTVLVDLDLSTNPVPVAPGPCTGIRYRTVLYECTVGGGLFRSAGEIPTGVSRSF